MSLLILSGIITAAGTVGVVTVQTLRQAIAVDQGLIAYYAAESGVEDGLYEFRKKETTLAAMPGSGSLVNGSTWSRTTSNANTSLTKTVAQNSSWEINLYDQDSSLSPLSNPIKSVRLAWTGSGSEWAEVEITPWGSDGNIQTPTTQLFSSASNPALVNLQDATTVLYRLRVKALYAALTNLTVTAYSGLNATGAQVNIPAQITLISTGSFSRSKQAVRALMPNRTPLSDVFGYVIFTEDDLVKP